MPSSQNFRIWSPRLVAPMAPSALREVSQVYVPKSVRRSCSRCSEFAPVHMHPCFLLECWAKAAAGFRFCLADFLALIGMTGTVDDAARTCPASCSDVSHSVIRSALASVTTECRVAAIDDETKEALCRGEPNARCIASCVIIFAKRIYEWSMHLRLYVVSCLYFRLGT